MTTEKMTIHKALVELKTLEDRIYKAVTSNPFVISNKHSNTKISGISVSEYCKQMESAYQKARDLITRRDAIKRAVVLSNASTLVAIADKQYTVAEAIDIKNHGIGYLQNLLAKMSKDYNYAQREADAHNGDALEGRADEYIRSLYGNTDMKSLTDEVKKVRTDFIVAQTYELLDPLKVCLEMERLEQEINEFIIDVDSSLSVSNAITEISLSY